MKNLTALVAIGSLTPSLAFATTGGGAFPPRQNSSSWSSAQFYQQQAEPSTIRELAVVQQVMVGNVPDRLRSFVAVSFPAVLNGQNVVIEVEVAPDYLMIGTDADFVRTPLTNYAAQYLAGELGFVLPTAFLVDQIYAQATTQLVPQPTNWYLNAPTMRLGPNYVLFNQSIETQRDGRGGLVGGHKKDVVVTNLLDRASDRVAIYGWQEPGGKPIQPLGTPHDFTYEDYSHGIRFIGPRLTVTVPSTGKVTTWAIASALKDTRLGNILNGGHGPLHDVRAARRCTSEFAKTLGLVTCPQLVP